MAHCRRKGFCIRCEMQERGKVYKARAMMPDGTSWLTSGIKGGLWGLGCTACSEYLASGRTCNAARFSKLARFQVRPESGRATRWVIEQHERRVSHRAACGGNRFTLQVVEPQPLVCPLVLDAQESAAQCDEDAELLNGERAIARRMEGGVGVDVRACVAA